MNKMEQNLLIMNIQMSNHTHDYALKQGWYDFVMIDQDPDAGHMNSEDLLWFLLIVLVPILTVKRYKFSL